MPALTFNTAWQIEILVLQLERERIFHNNFVQFQEGHLMTVWLFCICDSE